MHLIAFFSSKLSPAELNYDVENQELLAVKLVWKNGNIGWKALNNPSLYSQIIRTWNIYARMC